jgi:hypothetical protein
MPGNTHTLKNLRLIMFIFWVGLGFALRSFSDWLIMYIFKSGYVVPMVVASF